MLNKQFGCGLILVQFANPNGNTENGMPRQMDETGIISPFALKSQVRRQLESDVNGALEGLNTDNYKVFESRSRGFEDTDELKCLKRVKDMIADNPDGFLDRYFDVRMFGTTALGKAKKKGEATRFIRRGAVQFGYCHSLNPINIYVSGLTKKAPLEEKHYKSDDNRGETGTMGPDAIKVVEFGLYQFTYYINPAEAKSNRIRPEDVEVLKKLIPNMFRFAPSVNTAGVEVIQLFHFDHGNTMGSFSEIVAKTDCTPLMKENPKLLKDVVLVGIDDLKVKYGDKVSQLV